MEFMYSKAGKKLFVIEKYKIGFLKNLSEGTAWWKCTKRGYTAFVKLLKEVTVELNLNHNHEADTILARQQINNSLKRKANEALCERIIMSMQIIRFRKNLNAAKLRKFPKLPPTVLELYKCVRTYSPKNTSDENLVFHNDEMSNVIIFTCQQNLDTLQHTTPVFVDGTFKSGTPKLFC